MTSDATMRRGSRARRFTATLLAMGLAVGVGLAWSTQQASAAIAFKAPKIVVEAGLNGTPADFGLPTAAEVDPKSGRLLVTTQCGKVYAFNLDAQSNATFAFVLNQVNQYPNFQFNGTTLKPSVKGVCGDGNGSTPDNGRQTTGLTFDPTPPAGKTVLYVSHSDPEIFSNQAPAANSINPSSGVVTKFVIGGPGLSTVESVTHPVTGLARSGENHSVNGMDFGPDGKLYLSTGGNTNFGGKSSFFSWFPETHTAGTVAAINVDAIGAGTVDVKAYSRFAFTSTGTPPATSYEKPVGSSLGINADSGGNVTLFANGFRNGYDIVWHSNGKLYLNENEGNGGLGGTPGSDTGDTTCPGAGGPGPGTPPDELHLVSAGTYHGHPNPAAGNCNYDAPSGGVFGGSYQAPIFKYTPFNGATHRSVNALVEYDPVTDPFPSDGAKGQLIATAYSVNPAIYRLQLNAAGNAVVGRDKIADLPGVLGAAVGVDGTIFATTLFQASVHGGRVLAYQPDSIIGPCPKPGNPAVNDSDNDGFSDLAETEAGSNPCSAASVPADSDGDGIADSVDPDNDNDGIPDVSDQLQLDKTNGKDTKLPFTLDFNAAAGGGWFGTGFKGVQLSSKGGKPISGRVAAGAAGGFMQMISTNGTNRGSANNQDNALQAGLVPSGPFQASVLLGQPFDTGTPKGDESSGLFFGPNEDNFIQVGVNANNGNPIIEFYAELDGTGNRVASAPLSLPQESVNFLIGVDPTSKQVRASYQLHNGPVVPLATVGVPPSWLAAPALAGVAGTSNGGDGERPYIFDNFKLETSPAITGVGANGLCAPAPRKATKKASKGKFTFSLKQLQIDQRISSAAVRRTAAIESWLNTGIVSRDLCGAGINADDLATDVKKAIGTAVAAERANPRAVVVLKAGKATGTFRLSAGQLRINQRISSAAVRRLNALEARLKVLTGGDFANGGQITPGKLAPGLQILAGGATKTPAKSKTVVKPAGKPSGNFRFDKGQLQINQKISQAAVLRSNALIAQLTQGLSGANFLDGSITAAQVSGKK